MQNNGYLKSKRTAEADEKYTPYYAVDPIIKYIPKKSVIWLPFDKEWSAFYQTKKRQSRKVRSSFRDGFMNRMAVIQKHKRKRLMMKN